jgi:hypothetical protein
MAGTDRYCIEGQSPMSQVGLDVEQGGTERHHGGALPWGGSRLIQMSVPVLQ